MIFSFYLNRQAVPLSRRNDGLINDLSRKENAGAASATLRCLHREDREEILRYFDGLIVPFRQSSWFIFIFILIWVISVADIWFHFVLPSGWHVPVIFFLPIMLAEIIRVRERFRVRKAVFLLRGVEVLNWWLEQQNMDWKSLKSAQWHSILANLEVVEDFEGLSSRSRQALRLKLGSIRRDGPSLQGDRLLKLSEKVDLVDTRDFRIKPSAQVV